MKGKILLAWSGGKDSNLALNELINDDRYEIVALLSTVTRDYDRISMHGVRRELIVKQAEAIGFPIDIVFIPKDCSNEEYEEKMKEKMLHWKERGIRGVAFGDIFLQDVREYRERNLAQIDMEAIFPLWGRESEKLAREFISLGFRALTTCVDGNVLSKDFVGREYDENFLKALPPSVDPSGENGEFHTFVYDGPLFKERVGFRKGEVVLRENRFYFCDLLPL